MVVNWTPIDEDLPEVDLPYDGKGTMVSRYLLLSFSNFSLPAVGRYQVDADGNGAFYLGDDTEPCVSEDLYVNAWMEIIPPYREE